tara:strand:- start:321 stop:572 length:252 start_codon:yes stop_codon:yes gene_type:complete
MARYRVALVGGQIENPFQTRKGPDPVSELPPPVQPFRVGGEREKLVLESAGTLRYGKCRRFRHSDIICNNVRERFKVSALKEA